MLRDHHSRARTHVCRTATLCLYTTLRPKESDGTLTRSACKIRWDDLNPGTHHRRTLIEINHLKEETFARENQNTLDERGELMDNNTIFDLLSTPAACVQLSLCEARFLALRWV